MRTVLVDEDAGGVVTVVGVARDVVAFVDDEAAFVRLAGESLGHDGAGEARAYDEVIKAVHYGATFLRCLRR